MTSHSRSNASNGMTVSTLPSPGGKVEKHQLRDVQAIDQDDMDFVTDGFQRLNFAESPDSTISPSISTESSVTSATGKQKAQAKLKTALEDVKHFAGGLINHPYESTKHYSILRHSLGIVFYSGSYTNLAITIFADRELPPDRSLWLQRRGWSGKTGLKAGVLFRYKGAWINVTPTITATADQLKPTDERAWQRDIKKFLEKAPKELRNHKVRETNILRIPCEADDGYLRVVLCTGEKGKKFLCPSPIFRLASTSTDSSTVRGSSLMTLPLEASIKIASFVARGAATTALTPAGEMARSYATGQLSQIYQPSGLTKTAAQTAYNTSGVGDRLSNMNEQYDLSREASQSSIEAKSFDALTRPNVIGDESGPSEPFPIRFKGEVIEGSGESMSTLGLPSANLNGVPQDILLKYEGFFFGWVAINLTKKMKADPETSDISEDWHEAVVAIIPSTESRVKVVQKKSIRVYIIHDFGDSVRFFSATLSVMLMGLLRPTHQSHLNQDTTSQDNPSEPQSSTPSSPLSPVPQDPSSQLVDLYKDIAITTASLCRPAWSAESTLDLVKSRSSNRSLTEKYIDLRQSGQNKLDQMFPVHKVGVRTNTHSIKDKLLGNGGICVSR